MLADFDDSIIFKMPFKRRLLFWRLPLSVWDITFEQFVVSMKYIDSVATIPNYLQSITRVNKYIWNKSKLKLSLPAYDLYKSETEQILQMFKDVEDEAPKAKGVVKDMQEFGLTQMVSMIADGRVSDYPYVYKMTVADIYTEYRRKVWQSINLISESKANAANH
jgi:hypothetical protein